MDDLLSDDDEKSQQEATRLKKAVVQVLKETEGRELPLEDVLSAAMAYLPGRVSEDDEAVSRERRAAKAELEAADEEVRQVIRKENPKWSEERVQAEFERQINPFIDANRSGARYN